MHPSCDPEVTLPRSLLYPIQDSANHSHYHHLPTHPPSPRPFLSSIPRSLALEPSNRNTARAGEVLLDVISAVLHGDKSNKLGIDGPGGRARVPIFWHLGGASKTQDGSEAFVATGKKMVFSFTNCC